MAYGKIPPPLVDLNRLPSLLSYSLPSSKRLLVYPLTLEQTPKALVECMAECFRKEVESQSLAGRREERGDETSSG